MAGRPAPTGGRRRARTRTVESYSTALRLHVVPFFGGRSIQSIKPADLVAWHADQRRHGAATWSIKARWTPVRSLLAHAGREGLIPVNPADLLTARERPKAGPSGKRFLTDEEMQRLVEGTPDRYRVLVSVLLYGGLRIPEALGLRWADIDFNSEHIRVRHQLSRSGARVRLKSQAARRDIVLMPSLAPVLRELQLASPYS